MSGRSRIIASVLFFIAFQLTYSQVNKNWCLVKEDNQKILYLDNSRLDSSSLGYNIWVLSEYKNPLEIKDIKEKVKQKKENILLDYDSGTYSLIGFPIYLNDRLVEIDSDRGGLQSMDSFPIAGNPDVSAVLSYLKKGKTSQNSERESALKKNDADMKPDSNTIVLHEKMPKTAPKNLAEEKPKPHPEDREALSYKTSGEKEVRPGIFFNGSSYQVQHSAWLEYQKAQKMSAKLEARGYSTMITETFNRKKNAKFYRVRVGQYNSLKKASLVQKGIMSLK